jgi:hypothetical protein
VATVPFTFPDRTTLSERDRVVVRAVAEAMFSGVPLDGARLDEHVTEVDRFVSAASRSLRFGLRVMLLLVRFAPLFLLFRARPLERLTVDERLVVLDRLERSHVLALSLAFVGWRTVMTILFYEDPRELAAIGYTEARRDRLALPVLPVVAPGVVPVPTESGVRLGDAHDLDEATSSREVA